jgi:hypothetical protein
LVHCCPDATGEQFLVPDAAGESPWVWCFAWLLLVGKEAGSVVFAPPSPPCVRHSIGAASSWGPHPQDIANPGVVAGVLLYRTAGAGGWLCP